MKERKKTVGIITLHRITNYGSVLQAYALQEMVKRLGFDVEIIDYRPSRATMSSMLKGLRNKTNLLRKSFFARTAARVIILPSYILRFKCFKQFVNGYLDLTKNSCIVEKDFKTKLPVFDIYCTGSDQVWNSEWNGMIDGPLFLDFAPDDAKKIAYAASFGKEELDEWEIEETKRLLERYDYIAVRELSGKKILDKLGINNSGCVLDPTLLFDGKIWKKIASDRFKNEKYILVYNLNRNKKIHDYAVKLSQKTGLKIKYITYQVHDFYKKGKMYCNTSVENYLALIANATYIVTDSFHGVAFSINFNKDFVVIYPEKFSSRLRSILEITGLFDRVVEDGSLDIINKKINYKTVNDKISNERDKSIAYLRTALGMNTDGQK